MILASGGIGDNILFSLVVDRFASFAEPDEPVTVLIRRDAAQAAFLFPPGISIETYDWKKFRRNILYRWLICVKMRKKKLRLVISTDYDRHPLVDEIIIAACRATAWAEAARPSQKHAAARLRHECIFSRLINGPEKMHRLARWVYLANSFGETKRNVPFRAPRIHPIEPRMDIVVLHPFSSDKRRELSPRTFETILSAIPQRFRVLLSCAPNDVKHRPEWQQLIDDHRITLDTSPLSRKFDTLKRSALLVTVDTSLVHLGALAGSATLCLCTDAYRGWSVPYEEPFLPAHVRFFMASCEQSGCLGNCPYPLEQGAFRCLARLPMGYVLKDLRAILERNSAQVTPL